MTDKQMQIYNDLYNRIAKIGIDLRLYDEKFDYENRNLRFDHKYHKGRVIIVNEQTGITVYEDYLEVL